MKTTVRRKPEAASAPRLGVDDWIRAGLEILADSGIDGVRVEPLARKLVVTKGSFYWHFKDRAAFLTALLETWRKRATLSIIERLEHSTQGPRERLHALMSLSRDTSKSEFGVAIELAMRLWGRTDSKAQEALEEVDQLRIRYITKLVMATGVGQREANARAVLAYAYMRVAPSLPTSAIPTLSQVEAVLFPS
jgi:AcrR family transcriptional regulator